MADDLAQDIARFFATDLAAFDMAYDAWLAGDEDPEWDETKVKRDEEGKFAEQAEAGVEVAARPLPSGPEAPPPRRARRPAAAKPPRVRGAQQFVSPNVGNIQFTQAQADLYGTPQRLLGEMSKAIDARLGITGTEQKDVIGAWTDGAENSLMARMSGDPLMIRASAIIKGAVTNQKAVLLFEPKADADHVMLDFELKGDVRQIHTDLLNAGIENHTLEPIEGGARVYVLAMEEAQGQAVRAFLDPQGIKPGATVGNGDFIGKAWDYAAKGTTDEERDADERAEAQRVYLEAFGVVKDLARGKGQDLQSAWDDAHHHWRAATGASQEALAGSAPGSHPALISSRRPTAGTAMESDRFRRPDLAAMEADEDVFRDNTALLSDTTIYPNFRAADLAGKTPKEKARLAIDQFKSNLKALYRITPQQLRTEAHKWYEGAHNLAAVEAQAYNLPLASSVGVYAALSPQKDWDENVYLAQQLIEIHQTKRGHRWDDDMARTAAVIWAPKPLSKKAIAAGKTKGPRTLANEAATAKLIDAIRGKALGELTDPIEQAAWIRTYNEAKSDRLYQHYSPDGRPLGTAKGKDGKPIAASWQNTPAIAKAITALESGGDRTLLSSIMGDMHKVRSFYNNILDPNSENGDVTVDTHAVGAAALRGLTSNSPSVAQAWGASLDPKFQTPGYKGARGSDKTGMRGLYGIYADAYREAAAELSQEFNVKIHPRTLQSAVWEQKRRLFEDDVIGMVRPGKPTPRDEIEQTWRDFAGGERTLEATQAEIFRIADQARKDYDERAAEAAAKASRPRKASDGDLDARPAGAVDGGAQHPRHQGDVYTPGLGQRSARGQGLVARTGGDVARGVAPDLDQGIRAFFGQDAEFREEDVKRDEEGKFAKQAGGGASSATPKAPKQSLAQIKRQAANLDEMKDYDLDDALSYLWWNRQSQTEEGVWKSQADKRLYDRLNAERIKRRAKTAMGPGRTMHYTKARVRVDKILRGPDKIEDRDEAFSKIADTVAEAMDYPQRDRIKFSPEVKTFTLGGKERQYAGAAWSSGERRGDIEIYTNVATLGSSAGLMAHEVMHQKYQAILDLLGEETRAIRELERGEGNINRVRFADDSLRPEYQEQFPLYHRLNPRGLGHSLLTEPRLDDEDGVTDYSRDWWEEVKAGKANRYTAINETLAEMAQLEWEGSLPRLVWYKDSTAYRPLYEAMREFSKGRKVHGPTTADAAFDAAIRTFLRAA